MRRCLAATLVVLLTLPVVLATGTTAVAAPCCETLGADCHGNTNAAWECCEIERPASVLGSTVRPGADPRPLIVPPSSSPLDMSPPARVAAPRVRLDLAPSASPPLHSVLRI